MLGEESSPGVAAKRIVGLREPDRTIQEPETTIGPAVSKDVHRRRVRFVMFIGIPLAALLATTFLSIVWVSTTLPRVLPGVSGLETQPLSGSSVYDSNDAVLTEFHVERRIFVPLASIPQMLRDAVIATEDKRFYWHFGVDPMKISGALYQKLWGKPTVDDSSTLTQRLVKMLSLEESELSIEGKLKEVLLALEVERRYAKDRILEMYLNQVYFGHDAYGVEAAARTYFGKSVSDLNVAEAALLAGLPSAPSAYSPFDHPDAAKHRREVVLTRMVEFGVLTAAEARRIAASDLGLLPPERRRDTGQHFLEYVQQALEAKFGADMVFKGGLHVYTTSNPAMQLQAEQSLREGLKALESRTGVTGPDRPEGAILTIEPQTGYIRAMVGGSDFPRSEFNRAVQARRQSGAAFKPFVYIAALESGFTPATFMDDSPVSYPIGREGQPWRPVNYDRKFRGPTTLQQAVEESVNVVAVKLQERIGINRTVQVARRMGLASPLNTDLTLALGSSDVTLLELTSAYGALANQGVWLEPTTIRYVTDDEAKLLVEHVPQGREALSPDIAYVITHMLRGVVERGAGMGATLRRSKAAGMAGSTSSDVWFIGYTPRLVTGIWVGFDRPDVKRHDIGSGVAVSIWKAYMSKVLATAKKEDFPIPGGVTVVLVDEDPSGECIRPVPMAFIVGTEPRTTCAGPGQRKRATEP